ncbi:MAG: Lrp/AsnC family transcriptional regulator [Dehalococcoidales bacterium]
MVVNHHNLCYYILIMSTSIDPLDRQLIDILMKDARRSSIVLGKQLNVSSSTIRRRIKRLVEEGVANIVAVPEPSKVGLMVEAIIALDVSHEKIDSILQALGDYPQVRWVAATSGRFDVMVYLWLVSTEELYRFIENEVGKLEGVLKSETFICLHVEKRS